jgi:DNA polymerase III epsilon subunit-like protein
LERQAVPFGREAVGLPFEPIASCVEPPMRGMKRRLAMTPKRILILDTETGGLDPALHPCIEVACILYDLEQAEPLASFASLIRASENAAEHVNHIPLALLADAPEAKDVWPHVEALAARADVIVAHRADFDRGFVSPTLKAAAWACSKFWIE